MRLVTRFRHRRGLAVIAVLGPLALLPVWLTLSNMNLLSEPMDSNLPPFSFNIRVLPMRYWTHRLMFPERYMDDHSCMKFPYVDQIQYIFNSWQAVQVDNGSMYVYGAYYDNRFKEPLVRILIHTDVALPNLFCKFWFQDDSYPQMEVAEPNAWSPKWWPFDGANQPFLLTCKCKKHPFAENIPPAAVAVVREPCGVTSNILKVQGVSVNDQHFMEDEPPHPGGTSVAVCLKLLEYRNDVSVQVIEWLQLLKHFGAKKVFVYIVTVHPNTRKVLKYYEKEGFVAITELPQASEQSRNARALMNYKMELIQLNDCLYRSVGSYDWIAFLELDEILVTPPGTTWADVIDNETVKALAKSGGAPIDALVFPSYYILDGAQKAQVAPADTRILAHPWRSKTPNPPGLTYKSIFNVSSVIIMHNHSRLSCHGVLGSCRQRLLRDSSGRMLHFRKKCPLDREDCKELRDVVREDFLDVWREPVLAEVRAVLKKLQLEGLEL